MAFRVDDLFWRHDLSAILRNQEQKLFQQIDAVDRDQLLTTGVDDWCDYFEQQFKVDVPKLKQNEVQVDQDEANVDANQDRARDIRDRNQAFYIRGTRITFLVPFEGDRELFKCRPSTYSTTHPFGTIDQNTLVLTYTRTDHDAEAIKVAFNRDMSEIQKCLDWIEEDVRPFNESLRTKIKQRIEGRREKLLKDQGLVTALGFPLRRRQNAPETYVAPSVRRKAKISPPSPSSTPFVPEPTLELQEYDHILSVISDMVAVMERSPRAFMGMAEEDLRQHFLVQLNGQYEGQATGETFNFEGKTDILIRAEGKNIFVAECKFWRGPESLTKAIGQLLGYATWRDTKTALLIFNRGKDFSSVLPKIPEVVKSHPNFKRELSYGSETAFRFVLHHRDDKNRELILTVLAFEVPA